MRMRTVIGLSLGFMAALVLIGILPLLAQDGPSFSIVQPQVSQKVTGTQLPIVIEFTCDDDAPAVRFEAYIDSTSLIWGRIRKPISRGHFRVDADLNEISVKPGPHTLYIKLYDSKGRVSQREQRIILESPNTVRADSKPPRVRITSPKEGQVVTGRTDIKVEAVDEESGVKWVMIFINDQMRAYTNEAPYGMQWNPFDEKVLLSSYIIRARAMDLFDNEGLSLPVTVKVVKENRTGIDEGDLRGDRGGDLIEIPVFPVWDGPMPSQGKGAERELFASNLVRPTPSLPEMLSDLPPVRFWDRPGVLPSTGVVAVALLPVKVLPGQTINEAMASAESRGQYVPVALASSPGFTRPLLGASPLSAARGELSAPAELHVAARALPAGTMLVALLPSSSKLIPGGTADRLSADGIVVNMVQPVALVNPDGPARSTLSAPSVTSVAGAFLVPAAQQAAAQGVSPEMVLVAMAPGTTAKLNPRTGATTHEVMLSSTGTIIVMQPRGTGAATRPAMVAERTPSVRVLPDALGVEKVGERGTLSESPIIIALAPNDGKRMPASSALTAIAASQGTRAQELALHGDGRLARAANDTTLPKLTPAELAASTAPQGDPRAVKSATVTDAPLLVLGSGKRMPATGSAAQEDGTLRGREPQAVLLVAGGTMDRAQGTPTMTARIGEGPAVLGPPAARDRRFEQESASLQVASLPGKVAPAVMTDAPPLTVARPAQGVTPTTRVASNPLETTRPAAQQQEAQWLDVEQNYQVKDGQTLVEIARVYETTPEELLKLNPGISPERPLPVGTSLVVPKQSARIYVDDTPIVGGPNPFIAQGHSMVPFRQIVEAKGGVVVWLPATREINAWANNTYMGLKIGAGEARINDGTYTLPVVPTIREARAMVPLRYLMTAMRLQVTYNPKTGTYLLVGQAGK